MLTISPVRRALAALVASTLLGTLALADTQTVQAEIPLTTTNWSNTLTIPKFDPANGTLTQVLVRFETSILGSVAVENLSPVPQTIGATLTGTIRMQDEGGAPLLLESIPSIPVAIPPLTAYDGVADFRGTSGFQVSNLADTDVITFSIPPKQLPPLDVLTLDRFLGPGNLVFPVAAQGNSFFTGNTGNEAGGFTLQASAKLVVTYVFVGEKEPCEANVPNIPGSLLLFPRFDNRPNTVTMVTVTNTNCDFSEVGLNLYNGTVDVEFVYIGRYGPNGSDLPCLETNRTRRLTPCDTITVLTRVDNPNHERGFLYAFAKHPVTGQAIVFNHLIGQAMFFGGGMLSDPVRDALDARSFLGMGADRSPTDLDGDLVRDLDGLEYSEAPDEILIPRFMGQDGGAPEGGGPSVFESRLVLLGLSGGIHFTTLVYILAYNDNEEPFSAQYQFRCWDDPKLRDINSSFLESFLDTTNNDPNEIVGAVGRESGWIRVNGQIAFSSADAISNPAIYAVLFERWGSYVVADLPWELCTQDNGDLFPKGIIAED